MTASNDECALAVCAVMEFVAILRTMLLEGRFCPWALFAAFMNRLWFAVAQNMYCERRQSVITFGLGWGLPDCIALAGCAFVVLVLVHFAVVLCTCNWSYWNCLC